MIKGAKKQMIVVRTVGSRMFDEAYFVLRRQCKEEEYGREEMMREANRILSEGNELPEKRTRRMRGWLFFAGGIFLGLLAGILLGMWLL